MDAAPSDALVFFGATGDLAYKQIFPALQGLVRDEGLDMSPSSASPNPAGASNSFARAPKTVSNITGAFNDADFARLRQTPELCRRRLQRSANVRATETGAGAAPGGPCTISRSRPRYSAPSDRRSPRAGSTRTRASWSRSRSAAISSRRRRSTGRWSSTSPRRRSSGSTTTWARSPCRTSSIPGSPMRCSSRCGTGNMSAASRSPWRKLSALQDRGSFYDATGALRDVVQNHLLQVVANLMMEPPSGEESRGHCAIRKPR